MQIPAPKALLLLFYHCELLKRGTTFFISLPKVWSLLKYVVKIEKMSSGNVPEAGGFPLWGVRSHLSSLPPPGSISCVWPVASPSALYFFPPTAMLSFHKSQRVYHLVWEVFFHKLLFGVFFSKAAHPILLCFSANCLFSLTLLICWSLSVRGSSIWLNFFLPHLFTPLDSFHSSTGALTRSVSHLWVWWFCWRLFLIFLSAFSVLTTFHQAAVVALYCWNVYHYMEQWDCCEESWSLLLSICEGPNV